MLKALGSGEVVAGSCLAAAVALYPAWGSSPRWAETATIALLILAVTSLMARAAGAQPLRLVAVGALLAACAVGYDSLRGHEGVLALSAGQGALAFEELLPSGRSLGFRPLGFDVALDEADPDARVVTLAVLSHGERSTLRISANQARGFGGFRFGDPQFAPTGQAQSLRVAIEGGPAREVVELGPGRAGRAGDLLLDLERYFPDFALDDHQQPFSRSDESKNPAALLTVRRGEKHWRVFVIRALPGLHRPEGLDRAFALEAVVAGQAVHLSVSGEPAAPAAALGLLLAAVGLVGIGLRQ